MKKGLLLFSCVALMLSCGGNVKSGTSVFNDESTENVPVKMSEKEKAYIKPPTPPGVIVVNRLHEPLGEYEEPLRIMKRNRFHVIVKEKQLFVYSGEKEVQKVEFENLKAMYEEFMMNPNNDADYTSMCEVDVPIIGVQSLPKNAVCMLEYDSLSSEEFRFQVSEAIYSVVNGLRNSLALRTVGTQFDDCNDDLKNAFREAYPCNVVEYFAGNPPTSFVIAGDETAKVDDNVSDSEKETLANIINDICRSINERNYKYRMPCSPELNSLIDKAGNMVHFWAEKTGGYDDFVDEQYYISWINAQDYETLTFEITQYEKVSGNSIYAYVQVVDSWQGAADLHRIEFVRSGEDWVVEDVRTLGFRGERYKGEGYSQKEIIKDFIERHKSILSEMSAKNPSAEIADIEEIVDVVCADDIYVE